MNLTEQESLATRLARKNKAVPDEVLIFENEQALEQWQEEYPEIVLSDVLKYQDIVYGIIAYVKT